jgi:hypothetical protein
VKPASTEPLRAALDALLDLDAIAELAAHARGLRAVDELAARLEHEAVRSDRASESYAERGRYDLAAGERDRAELLRRRAAALRVLEAQRVALTPT